MKDKYMHQDKEVCQRTQLGDLVEVNVVDFAIWFWLIINAGRDRMVSRKYFNTPKDGKTMCW